MGCLVGQFVHQFVILSSFEVYRQFLHHCPAPQPKCLHTCRTQEEFPYLKPQIYLKYISNPKYLKYPKYISNQSFQALIGPLNPQNNSLIPQKNPLRLQISPLLGLNSTGPNSSNQTSTPLLLGSYQNNPVKHGNLKPWMPNDRFEQAKLEPGRFDLQSVNADLTPERTYRVIGRN